ncbi:MAG: hypothetical protein ACO2OX_02205 [Candidatus Nanopusillus sp.]|jgi:uncharacterized membrane protein (DUF106 family)
MINTLFFYVLFLVILVNIIIRIIQKKLGIGEHQKKLQEIQKKYIESFKSGKLEELSSIMGEITKIYSKIMKHTIIITIFGIFVLIFIIFAFQSGFYITNINNTTSILITNPILYNQDFAIYYNNSFLGFYRANYNIITLNGTYDPKLLSVNVITNTLPFYLPIININWLNPLLLYIILYILVQISLLVFNIIYSRFIKKSKIDNKNG